MAILCSEVEGSLLLLIFNIDTCRWRSISIGRTHLSCSSRLLKL